MRAAFGGQRLVHTARPVLGLAAPREPGPVGANVRLSRSRRNEGIWLWWVDLIGRVVMALASLILLLFS